jgi:hypothetical protein
MASKVQAAIEKLLQFGSHTQPDAPISRKELTPYFAAIADALIEIDNGLNTGAAETARVKALATQKPLRPADKPPLASR